jgi:acetyltransferase-like isoleucine patch superfamily enzyme
MGEHTYGDRKISTISYGNNKGKLKIGKFCSIGPNVVVMLDGNHRTDWVTTYPFPSFSAKWKNAKTIKDPPQKSKGDIIIKNDVWIGRDVWILSGVTIHDGAVIGAKSVVAKDIPPYSIAVGNPAQIVKKRFPDNVINHLLKLKWWDLPDNKINKLIPILCSTDIYKILEVPITHG